ncbi:hypothetical protein SAMN05444422_10621 [Halobiforma haloterrestris]|uniref:Homeodomain-like domain-containing protein n=1 Tax=Natronobacterium haloterrestre TaxID=148448 RepID=A0A1I1HJX3_NATHA|nr:helix-turn-helix transcriptional regulator [Halobiforma haloterrestris]SFC24126.1 hypothetical protein SAMN05444422_10621 [Halobiforma haloterrestris]
MPSREYKGDPIDGGYQHISERAERTEVPQDNAHDGQEESTLLSDLDATPLQKDIIEVAMVMPSASYTDIHQACQDRGINTAYQTVRETVQDYLPTKNKETNPSATDEPKPWRDEGRLRELYVEQEMTMTEVGDELGCSHKTIENWLKKHGIPKRPKGTPELKDPDWLRQKYHTEGLTLCEIADELELADHTPVLRGMQNHGIERRDSGYLKNTSPNRNKVPRKRIKIREIAAEMDEPTTGAVYERLKVEEYDVAYEYVSTVLNGHYDKQDGIAEQGEGND